MVYNWFRGSSRGLTTIRILEHNFIRNTSMFHAGHHYWFHCDTGNGNRGYDLFYFLSCVWPRYRASCEWVPFCADHAYSECDTHAAYIEALVDPIKRRSRIIELKEFAAVSSRVPNTMAYYHEDAIDDATTIFAQPSWHPPLPTLSRDSGIRQVGHAQFRWQATDGSWVAEEGICRVTRLAGGSDWTICDLVSRRPALCAPCTARAMRPQRHQDDEPCPLRHAPKLHAAQAGIQVLHASLSNTLTLSILVRLLCVVSPVRLL